MGIDILGIDIVGVDILGIDILALPRLQYSFHLNTKVTLYCDAKMNVISDVLHDREGRFSKTTTNF